MNEPTHSQLLIYQTEDGRIKLDVRFEGETVWLTQKALADLFGVQVPGINMHLKNIYDSGELNRAATVSKMEMVRPEGGREVEIFNLDAIIAVGQRVNRAVAATHKEFLSIRPDGNPGEGPVVKESLTTDCDHNPIAKKVPRR